MNNLAPIGLSTYIRLSHLKLTIEALKQNALAEKSDLYIFSDGPKAGDEQKVIDTRKYLKTITGFKTINIIERIKNSRVRNNRDGIKLLLNKYGKMIYLEEDNITAPGFLAYINKGLNFYKENKKIFSICGYAPDMNIPNDYDREYFVLQKFSGWGFGIWKDRYDQIKEINKGELNNFKKTKKLKKFLKNVVSKNTLKLFELDANKEIDALDVKIVYHLFKNNLYSVFPIKSLIKNTGCDGSGTHCGMSDKYDVNLWNKLNFQFTTNIETDKKILRASHIFHRTSIKDRIRYFIKKIIDY
ncbi:MAG: hypothetical protein ABIF17_02770 [Patescibacteria group bacterium]